MRKAFDEDFTAFNELIESDIGSGKVLAPDVAEVSDDDVLASVAAAVSSRAAET